MITITACAVGYTIAGCRTTAAPGSATAVEPEMSEGSSPADIGKYLLVDTDAMNAKEFYAAQDAERAEADRQTRAEFRGLCDGLEGAPRVNPVIPVELRAAWEKGYDDGVRRAALARLTKPESERRIA